MLKGKASYYLILVLFAAAAAWVGYFVAQVFRSGSISSTTIIWLSIIAAAVVLGFGIVYFSTKHRHGEQQIPCNIQDTVNVRVKNYHFIMATSKRTTGKARIKSTDLVNGVAVEPVNNDGMPHRVRIEVRINEDSGLIASKDMVINPGTSAPVTLPLPDMLRLAEIDVVDIRIRQV